MAATGAAIALLLSRRFEFLKQGGNHMHGDIYQRGITVTDLAVVLFTALFVATTVIPLIVVDSVSFWSMVAR